VGERQVVAVAVNVLDLTFEAPAPNHKWIADFTYIWTAEGWLYVAAVRQCGRRQHDGEQDGDSTIWATAQRQPSLRDAAA